MSRMKYRSVLAAATLACVSNIVACTATQATPQNPICHIQTVCTWVLGSKPYCQPPGKHPNPPRCYPGTPAHKVCTQKKVCDN